MTDHGGAPAGDLCAQLAALAAGGADRFDPVRFQFIEALARRARQQREPVARLLEAKAGLALRDYRDGLAAARTQAAAHAGQLQARHPAAADEIQRLYGAFAFRELAALEHRLAAQGGRSALAELRALLQQGAPAPEAGGDPGLEELLHRQESALVGQAPTAKDLAPGREGELRAMRRCRASLARWRVERRVDEARASCPRDSGPLNPQRLAARSLDLMRELSPSYLHRFVAYFDTLLWLERSNAEHGGPAKAGGRGRRSASQ